MGKWLKRIVLIVLVAVFLFAGGSLLFKWYQDSRGEQGYEDAADQFTNVRPQSTARPSQGPDAPPQESAGAEEAPPLVVDFAALRAVNPDVVGWIYCEGTAINYPVLHGQNNDQYLRHLYDKSYNIAGSIFLESENKPDFSDTNTIIYGHNMDNGTMFGGLHNWQEQSYYEAHQSMWLLTPDQDYRIDLLGGYYTSARSDTYTVFRGFNEIFDDYLADLLSQSLFKSHAEMEPNTRYVVLSTCADSVAVNDSRFVLHGKLVPVDSVDGVSKID